MANEYLKPQIPLKDLNSENYFYPLTTLDQIIIGNSRLSAYLQENDGKLIFNNIDEDSVGGSIKLDGITINRTLFVENDSLLSSENIFINNSSLAINKTSITDGYNFEVNGNSYLNGDLNISGKVIGFLQEDNINWGGKEGQNTMGPLDYALNDYTRGNVWAGINPAAIKIEFSTDNGSTWTEHTGDYSTLKKQLFTTYGYLRLVQSGDVSVDSKTQVKVTLTIKGNSVYTELKKIHIGLSTNYSSECKVTIKGAKGASITTFDQIICENVGLSGWSGWNSISCNCTIGSNDGQIGALQFIFSHTSIASDRLANGLTINSIRGYGQYHWSYPSNMSRTDKDYWYDENLIMHVNTGLTIQNDNSNNAWDALLYVKNNSNSDWSIKIAKSTYNYGLYVEGTGTDLLKIGTNNIFNVGNGNVQINGTTKHNGVVYFANGTSYFINNSAIGYLADFRVDQTRLVSNWLGFYASVNAGGNRYGYIQADVNRMRFRKENGAQGSISYDFAGHIYNSAEYISGADNGFRIKSVILRVDGSHFYFLIGTANTPGNNWNSLRPFYFNLSNGYSYHTRAYQAVWNDYAEFRQGDTIEPGRVVIEQKNGIMTMAQERLVPGAKIISDTYGQAMGETKKAKTPIAVSGRVLVYPFKDRNEYELGAAVCAAPGGTVDIMTREEIREYPERIIGTVSEIPTYTVWHAGGSVKDGPTEEIKVNGRIWVYVR